MPYNFCGRVALQMKESNRKDCSPKRENKREYIRKLQLEITVLKSIVGEQKLI